MLDPPADVSIPSGAGDIAEATDDSELPLDWRDELSELASSLIRCHPDLMTIRAFATVTVVATDYLG